MESFESKKLCEAVNSRWSLGWDAQRLAEFEAKLLAVHVLLDEDHFSRPDVANVLSAFIEGYCHLDTDDAGSEELFGIVLDHVNI